MPNCSFSLQSRRSCTFNLFPELPPEVQQEIWNFACLDEGRNASRIQRIAPDHYIIIPITEIKIRIIKEKAYQVPTLLQICQTARNIGLRYHWTLWSTWDTRCQKDDETKVYVNKTHDIFYFGRDIYDNFGILRNLVRGRQPAHIEEKASDRQDLYTDKCRGICHIAVDWEVWLSTFARGRFEWMPLISCGDMNELTIVLDNPISESNKWTRCKGRMSSITPCTVRYRCADHISYWIDPNPHSSWRYFDSEEGDGTLHLHPIPKINVKVMTSHVGLDDEDSNEDRTAYSKLNLQTAWYDINCQIEQLEDSRALLQRKMDRSGVSFPPPMEGYTISGTWLEGQAADDFDEW